MISKSELKDFRVFENLTLDSLNALVILSGKNDNGKTSNLEVLY
jgi:recombinational DNA repair ATPase RecF